MANKNLLGIKHNLQCSRVVIWGKNSFILLTQYL